ncbi:MAG: 2,4-diaminopentanoate dehydrogenase [Spirochaetes bacterium]|nr:2,4-diaminopentanoate dehydrogenase [Spirochaetota bacterium]
MTIKVVQWGVGAMGSGMIRMMLNKKNIEIVGAIVNHNPNNYSDVGEYIGIGKKNIPLYMNPKDILKKGKVDVVLHATKSFTKEVFDDLVLCMENSINVITIAEEMSYPYAQNPDLAKKLDEIAKKNNVVCIGTGINPGFVLDTLIITLTAPCIRVDKIEAQRINDLSPFGKTVMETQGVGTTVEEFNNGLKSGKIVGHIGFPESIHLIAKALNWEISEVKEFREPIISNVYRETPVVKVQPGMVAGCKHIGIGYDRNGNEKIKLIHPQQIHPHLEKVDTGDYIHIYGEPEIKMAIQPEIPGGKGTMAMAVNIIPQIVNSEKKGLLTMLDLKIPHSIPDKD